MTKLENLHVLRDRVGLRPTELSILRMTEDDQCEGPHHTMVMKGEVIRLTHRQDQGESHRSPAMSSWCSGQGEAFTDGYFGSKLLAFHLSFLPSFLNSPDRGGSSGSSAPRWREKPAAIG